MRHTAVLLVAMFCSVGAYAAEQLQGDDNKGDDNIGARSDTFISLDRARTMQGSSRLENGVKVSSPKKFYELRSDQQHMNNGQMRSDNQLRSAVIVSPQRQDKIPSGSQSADILSGTAREEKKDTSVFQTGDATDMSLESEEIAGNKETYNPVLALFDTGEAAPSSFHEAMKGRVSTSIRGLTRHFIWPIPLNVKQYVSSGYGMRIDPFHGRPAFHGGIDIAADAGTDVLATADGQVLDAKTDSNYGKYVTLQHADGTLTRYGHLGGHKVSEGQQVHAGEAIGVVGSTGRSTGAHLDYRVSKDGMKYDPLTILSVPTSVAIKKGTASVVAAMAMRGNSRIASKPIAKRPMVIEVR